MHSRPATPTVWAPRINFTDPLNGSAIAVHFDSYEEMVRDLHSQIVSAATGGSTTASYEVKIVLIEA